VEEGFGSLELRGDPARHVAGACELQRRRGLVDPVGSGTAVGGSRLTANGAKGVLLCFGY
jgi:hypothetical protein